MGRASVRDLGTVVIAAVAVTMLIAWPVIQSPATMIFGREMAGRHHDPFTAMRQFAEGGAPAPYLQPVTDVPGMVLATLAGPVVAYNIVVLASFPLAAVAAWALGRHLGSSRCGALVAGLLFAFAPAHLAHAAYHPHVAQTQWIPLYLLALFAAIDRPAMTRLLLLALAAVALALSNFYAVLIGAVITPLALVAYWWARHAGRGWRRLMLPAVVLTALCSLTAVSARAAAPSAATDLAHFAFPIEDVTHHGARWWSYLLPPIDHPWLGRLMQRAASRAGGGPGLVEQQLSLGWGLLALGAIVLLPWGRPGGVRQQALRGSNANGGCPRRVVAALAAIGAWATIVSLAPPLSGCESAPLWPSCAIHGVAPMFRAYARFGIVTSLVLALVAGIAVSGIDRFSVTMRSRLPPVVALLLALTAFEYWPLPGRARDVLPTAGHRWLAGQPADIRVVDCGLAAPADANVAWLMQREVRPPVPPLEGCDAVELAPTLAALEVTHLLRREPPSRPSNCQAPALRGLALVHEAHDARVYKVTAAAPAVAVVGLAGFHARERRRRDEWRWMGSDGRWTLRNTTGHTVAGSLVVGLESFARPRELGIDLDGAPHGAVTVAVERGEYAIGPLSLTPGDHVLRFRATGAATRPSDITASTDSRLLTVSFRSWRWREAAPETRMASASAASANAPAAARPRRSSPAYSANEAGSKLLR